VSAAGVRHPIRGAKVYLRPFEPEDADLVSDWVADVEVARLTGELPLSRHSRRVKLEQWLDAFDRDTADAFRFVICRLEDDRPIGRCDLFDIDRVNGNAALGITIGDRTLWGGGYGSDAVNALVDFGFGELRLERIWLATDAGNVRAQRSYARSGFLAEARLRNAFHDHGRFVDELRMALLRGEWEAQDRKRSWDYDAG
jgi:RimJ/RimL family protein N-acetyltransferase